MTDRYLILVENIAARDTTCLIIGVAALLLVGVYFLFPIKARDYFLAGVVLFYLALFVKYGLMPMFPYLIGG